MDNASKIRLIVKIIHHAKRIGITHTEITEMFRCMYAYNPELRPLAFNHFKQ